MIEYRGYLGKSTQHFSVYGAEGISPTLGACDHKDPTKIMEERE